MSVLLVLSVVRRLDWGQTVNVAEAIAPLIAAHTAFIGVLLVRNLLGRVLGV